ncbi:VOC family protein [Virgibacillus litoralis]|uniref:Enzyme related to lactoylglutathione lyase n=1 Tax=Virgibacillus litoralis TaxID=578221 RepID=A0ABS4HH16_9BACI|nr:VOC family protein [Virgibacillus litoralis]MBP1950220.1 putative enzyme related to lactoylglutathione lyase [Virgibacillus litoralis]
MEQEGKIISADLTVHEAEQVRNFYEYVIGWEHSEVNMGSYNDYIMTTKDGTPVAGVCHQVGSNEGLPPVWMVYFQVSDLNDSLETCRKLGGKVLREPGGSGCGSFAVIEYPAGAICALSQM